ncbi:hypothetical protein C5167_012317 [Papaver somniferum]|uniref:cellulase n=1 Tax=Papaver somniferum TaxID=3469 RepID=A0A4Y7J147_PAPSO|nr:hypothetical protein C5167_012317 [Papaver somniferum]
MDTTKCQHLFILVCFIYFLLFVQRVASVDYKDALTKSLLYFEAQRSGILPPNQRVTWRDNSALEDGQQAQVDLVGGYYDAGDNVKFGFPMAFTITMLSWSVVDFGKYLSAQDELTHALEAIKWGTDYLIKASPYDGILYGEVGEGSTDHVCWERPEDMTTPRTTYSIDAAHPGSDLAGETAAALAAASIAFNRSDHTYAATLLLHAKQLRDFAHDHKGHYQDSIVVAKDYYPSKFYTDELLWADIWLYYATFDEKYLNIFHENDDRDSPREFSWDQKDAGVQIMVNKLFYAGGLDYESETWPTYVDNAKQFICNCIQKGPENFQLTDSGGLLYFNEWNSLNYVTASLFLVLDYAEFIDAGLQCGDTLVNSGDLHNFVQLQDNITKVSCEQGFHAWYNKTEPNPNILYGAVVGGPNKGDRYTDSRANYKQNEPSTITVAPFVGILARLAQ